MNEGIAEADLREWLIRERRASLEKEVRDAGPRLVHVVPSDQLRPCLDSGGGRSCKVDRIITFDKRSLIKSENAPSRIVLCEVDTRSGIRTHAVDKSACKIDLNPSLIV